MKKLLLLTMLISGGAWADCSNIDSSTDKRECLQKKLDIVDKQLLTTYQESLKKTSPESKQQLVKAQRLWVQFKEADCLYDASRVDDRTGFASNQLSCLINKSTSREKELHLRLNDN
ncbi:lysozyme inhibitor LprI family protein [Acinetobacter guillouiae]|uniref:lysozyme inhibitor LprI family protein n=1 Tax=Acinetobacter guillouiae TaxID=106649 RepID=UPI002FDA4DD3